MLLCGITFKIPLPPVDEKKKVIEDVDKDRRYAIDASIVRIMKSRKVLFHQQLVTECVEQLGRMFKVFSTWTALNLPLLALNLLKIFSPLSEDVLCTFLLNVLPLLP